MNRLEMKDLTVERYENLIERVKTDRSSILLLEETQGDKCLYCEKYSKNYLSLAGNQLPGKNHSGQSVEKYTGIFG